MSRRLALTIGVAITGLAIAFVLATRTQRGSGPPITAILPRADGIQEGTIVTYLGLEIGYVEALHIDQGRVLATLRMRRSETGLRRGDTLRVRTSGLLRGLDISPGPLSAPPLGPTDTLIAVIPVPVPRDSLTVPSP